MVLQSRVVTAVSEFESHHPHLAALIPPAPRNLTPLTSGLLGHLHVHTLTHVNKIKHVIGAGEMPQWLGAFLVLAEYPGSGPSTHSGCLETTVPQSPGT